MSHAIAKSGLYWGRGGPSPDRGGWREGKAWAPRLGTWLRAAFRVCQTCRLSPWPSRGTPSRLALPPFSSNLEAVTSVVLLAPGWAWRMEMSAVQRPRTSGCEVFSASPARTGVCWLQEVELWGALPSPPPRVSFQRPLRPCQSSPHRTFRSCQVKIIPGESVMRWFK